MDLLTLIGRIPEGTAIPGLRNKLGVGVHTCTAVLYSAISAPRYLWKGNWMWMRPVLVS